MICGFVGECCPRDTWVFIMLIWLFLLSCDLPRIVVVIHSYISLLNKTRKAIQYTKLSKPFINKLSFSTAFRITFLKPFHFLQWLLVTIMHLIEVPLLLFAKIGDTMFWKTIVIGIWQNQKWIDLPLANTILVRIHSKIKFAFERPTQLKSCHFFHPYPHQQQEGCLKRELSRKFELTISVHVLHQLLRITWWQC